MSECPRCGHSAPFDRFADLGRCPECSTALMTLMDLGARQAVEEGLDR